MPGASEVPRADYRVYVRRPRRPTSERRLESGRSVEPRSVDCLGPGGVAVLRWEQLLFTTLHKLLDGLALEQHRRDVGQREARDHEKYRHTSVACMNE